MSDLEIILVDRRIRGLKVVQIDPELLSDGEKGVARLDCVLGVASTRDVDELSNLEVVFVDIWVCGLKRLQTDVEMLGDGEEGVAGLNGVLTHF